MMSCTPCAAPVPLNRASDIATSVAVVPSILPNPQGPETLTHDRSIADARHTPVGLLIHDVNSPLQAAPTKIRVLPPDKLDRSQRYPVVYVLPVEPLDETRFGDGLREVLTHKLHNQYQAIFVTPTFAHLPWYTDHPTDPQVRQESYFIDVVLPLVEKSYPVRPGLGGRYLLGFSKSGWGAFSLLLRHPDLFAKAAVWDAPLMMPAPSDFGMGPIFGTQANFARYQIGKLLQDRTAEVATGKRLILLGHGNFVQQVQQAHELMTQLHIAHEYLDGPNRAHTWHSGWVLPAVQLLLADCGQ